jgi:hypothetical protein
MRKRGHFRLFLSDISSLFRIDNFALHKLFQCVTPTTAASEVTTPSRLPALPGTASERFAPLSEK